MALTVKDISHARTLSQQRLSQKKGIRNSGYLFTAVKVIGIVVFIAMFYLWSRLEVVRIGYEIAKTNKNTEELMTDSERLRFEILTLKSPQRIEAMAMEKLGLVYPKGEQIIVVK